MGRMSGKVSLVTGAASGLGAETAVLFAEEGGQVVLADMNDERGAAVVQRITDAGGDAIYAHTDVTKNDQIEAAVALAESTFGKLNVVVANAGSAGHASRFDLQAVTEEDFNIVIDINLLGVWRTFKAAVPALRRAGGGSMTSTGSATSTAILGGSTLGAYTAVKHASLALTEHFAAELAAEGIRVNAVCPARMLTNFDETLQWNEEELAAARKRRGQVQEGPGLRSLAHPREVAFVHLFMNSDEAGFVTGQWIGVDAGMGLMFNRSMMITGN
jgi:NAD(P)-dependent dehydrogenase (short-subunit alcohol dehydrogenase family)